MTTKICSKCKEEKQLCEFAKDKRKPNGITSVCLSCVSQYQKNYYAKNSDKIIKRVKKYEIENKEKISKSSKLYYEKNKEKIREYKKKWTQLNKERINEKERERKKIPLIKLKHIVRNRILVYFKNKGYKKNTKTFDLIGCTAEELKKYIEKLFTDGMCWEKMGKEIHIDHIIPLSSAKTEEELYKLCHYSNLQPLWAKDNLSKKDKIV